MAKVDVIMPQMGESIAEGTLTRWLKEVGAEVERDEDLFEISTDKVDADIPSPASGVLAEILVAEGDTVEVNTIVARIETEKGASAADAAEAAPTAVAQEAPPSAPAAEIAEAPAAEMTDASAIAAEAADSGASTGSSAPAAPVSDTPITATAASTQTLEAPPVPPADGMTPASREERLRTRSTPLVRKIAAEHGVDIAQIEGSGIAGRVTRDDILAFIDEGGMQPVDAASRAEEVPAASAPSPPAPGVPSAAAAPPGPPGVMHLPIHGATLEVKLPR